MIARPRHRTVYVVIATLPLIFARSMSAAAPTPPPPAEQSQAEQTAPPADAAPQLPQDPSTPPPNTPAPTRPNSPDPSQLPQPIPDHGPLPPLYSTYYLKQHAELAHRAATRGYAQQLRQLRLKYFGQVKSKALRAEGIAQLREFTDPAAFLPMIKELAHESDDIRLAMLDHFAGGRDEETERARDEETGRRRDKEIERRRDEVREATPSPRPTASSSFLLNSEGQAALAWIVIYDHDAAIRNEALLRMTTPVGEPVMHVIDQALRSPKAEVANAAAIIVSSLNIVQAIPHLIFAQVNVTSNQQDENAGDLAWIAIQTQRAYVAGLQPVVGSNAGAFQPIIGVVSSGSVLRIHDAVVIEYRTVVHDALVNMTTPPMHPTLPTPPSSQNDQSTASLGYNVQAWWEWYNQTYVPAQAAKAERD